MEGKELVELFSDAQELSTYDCMSALLEPSKLLETVVAFANTDSGFIAIGLENPKKAAKDSHYHKPGQELPNNSFSEGVENKMK